MNVRLVVEQGGRRTVMKLRPPAAVLGRARGNTVRIPSAEVSRRHCRLLLKDGLVTLEDLDSANGTFLNGRRIKAPETVHPGDAIEVGPVTFVVEYELTTDALRRLRRDDDDIAEVVEVDAVEDEVVDAEELPMLEAASDEELEVREDDLVDVEAVEADEGDFVPDEFDVDPAPWKAPGGSLRNLLSGLQGGDDDE